jgi:UDP-3-O-[3-hydroxymyristoyl] glucosamine N-acyltransferase
MTCTAAELAEYLGAKLAGDALAPISGVASFSRARVEDLVYLDSPRYAGDAAKSAAVCVLARPGSQLPGKTTLEVSEPKFAFAKAAHWLLPESSPAAGVHPTAIIASDARIAANAHIGPYVVIEAATVVGSGTVIDAFCFVGRGSQIGEKCRLHPRVTLYAGSRLGHRVELHSGVVIGADGFGYVFGEGRHQKFPQIGTVEIGDDVEIGANTTIDRGSLETTRIGKGVKIDNLVQVAHNVQIGENSILAAQTGVSGSSTIGARAIVGGQVGIADHCKIEDGAIVGAQAGIPTGKTIRSGQIVWGTPARPLDKFKAQYAWFARLPELAARLARLEGEKPSR